MFTDLLTRFAGLDGWQIGLIATGLLLQGAIVSPFPEEVIIITLGILWGRGRIGFGEAMLFNCLGLVPGNLLPMILGRRFGARLLKRRPFTWMADPAEVAQALQRFNGRGGSWVIFVTRFLPFVRGPVYFAAGMTPMTYLRFTVVDIVAAVIQTALIQLAGYKMGENSQTLLVAYQRVGAVFVAIVAGGLVWAYLKALQRRRSPGRRPTRTPSC
jgi:membrane protein DedA with SNARE-associated domain